MYVCMYVCIYVVVVHIATRTTCTRSVGHVMCYNYTFAQYARACFLHSWSPQLH